MQIIFDIHYFTILPQTDLPIYVFRKHRSSQFNFKKFTSNTIYKIRMLQL